MTTTKTARKANAKRCERCAIRTTVRYDTTDPSRPGWYAEYSTADGVVDDSEKVWHPTMPTDPEARDEAEQIAREYAATLGVHEQAMDTGGGTTLAELRGPVRARAKRPEADWEDTDRYYRALLRLTVAQRARLTAEEVTDLRAALEDRAAAVVLESALDVEHRDRLLAEAAALTCSAEVTS